MLRRPKNKTKTVAEKVAELIAQTNGDENSDNSADEATAPRVVDFEPDEYELPEARSTEFRKKNIKLLSEQSARYKGKIASRKDFEQGSAEDDADEEAESDSDADEKEAQENDLAYEQSDSSEEDESMALAAFNKKLKCASVGINSDKHETNSWEEGDADDLAEDDDEDAQSDSADSYKEEADEDSEDDIDDDDDDDEDDDDDDDDEEPARQTTDIISKQNQQAEVQKGICVQNQLQIWERLLELRINAQKVLSKTNQLPAPETLQTQRAQQTALDAALTTTQQSAGKLLRRLLELQGTLTQQFSELRNALKTTHKRAAPFDDDGAPEPKRLATHLQSHFDEFRTYRNSVLLRWDDRTKLLTPGAGAKKKSMQEDYDVLKKIENSLANRSLLVSKSQTLKTDVHAAPKETADECAENEQMMVTNGHSETNQGRNMNVYDDSDFYHQQLRELIEYKANVSSNMSEVTKQFVELQKLRQKMKKKVDTRASKGRKLRYVVHNKLVNFMAPDDSSDWTEESKNELYKSLFV